MKNKWLIGALSCVMATTLCLGIAACGGNGTSDEEIAQSGITMLNGIYLDGEGKVRDYETPADYLILSRTKVGDEFYSVNWSVTSETENIGQYVKIGTEADESARYTVEITRATFDIEYTLTASITVGNATKTADYGHKIPKKSAEDSATASLSFETTASRVSQTATQQVWKSNGITFTNDKASSSSDIVDSKNPVRLYKGSKVTIEFPGIRKIDFHSEDDQYKYYTNLKGNLTAAFSESELSFDDENFIASLTLATPSDKVEFVCSAGQARLFSIDVEVKEGGLSDAEKLSAAKSSLKFEQVNYFMADTVTLPTEHDGATLTWELKGTSEYVSVENGTLKVTSLPADETEVTLIAHLTLNEEKDDKELSIKLLPTPTLTNDGTATKPYTAAEAKSIAKLVDADGFFSLAGEAKAVYIHGYVIAAGEWNGDFNNWTNVYIADSKTAQTTDEGALIVYRLVADGTLLAQEEAALKVGAEITVLGYLQNFKGNTPEVAAHGSNNVTATAYNYVDDRTADQKITDSLAAVPATLIVSATGETALPATTEPEVTFTWALKDGEKLPQGTAFADGKLTVTTLPAADTTVKFVVTAKLTGATDQTKEISVTIKAEGAVAECFTPITAPAAGSDYYLAMDIKGVWYYSTGAKSGNYLGTTTDISKAAKVTLAASGSGWTLVTNGKYIEFESSTSGTKTYVNIMLKDSQTTGKVWTWNEEHSVFTMDEGGETYFMGTFDDYTTFNSAKISFITNDNEYIGKIGTYTGTVEPEPELPDPTKGTEIVADGATVFDFSDVAVAEANDYSEMSETAILAAFDNFEGLTLTKSKIYAGNNNATSGPSDYRSAGGFLRMGSGSANGTLTLTFTKDITKIQILCLGWSASDTIAIDGFNPATIGNTAQVAYTYTLTEAVKSFTITTAKRALIFKIAVTFADGSTVDPEPEHVHKYTYEYNEGEWTHTGTCNEAGCDETTVTAECTPAYNICPDCKHEFTQDEILTKLFASKADTTMKGTYSLTGKVLRIDTAYASNFGNVTFTMKVGDKEIQCFREKSSHSATVKPGDTVTVQGTLKHYYNGTKEFDTGCEITNLTVGELTNAEKVSEALRAVTLPASTAEDITLPESTIEGVTFSWESDTVTSIKVEDGKLKVTQTAESVSVKITLTATCGTDATDTKEFTVIVDAKLAEGSETAEMKYSGSTTNMKGDNGNNATTVGLDEEIFNITSEKLSGNNQVGLNAKGQIRLYKSESVKLHINISAQYKIISIKVTLTSDSPAKMDNLKVVVGTDTVTGTGMNADKTVATFAVDGAKVSLSNTHGSSQIYIESIEIVYAPVSATVQAPAQVAILPGKQF